ncbi:MAG: YggS family pyridoxal phosphate-dependent enzyme [Perlucidibaca sp.]
MGRVRAAEQASARPSGCVSLLAVSKLQPAAAVRALRGHGQRAFGENYVQEALAKMAELDDLDIEWHLIGPLQSNKTREVATHFDWVHSLDRLKIAQRLSAQRPAGSPPLQVCLQVNIDDEDSKSGCSLSELPALAEAVAGLPGLRLRGLMTIPRPGNARALADLAKTHADLLARLPAVTTQYFDTLSMGMSDDLAEAVAAGSTLVRVGTAIFGARPARS